MIPVVSQPETVQKSRTESMVFFKGGNLPLGDGLLQDIVHRVRLCQGRVVVDVRPEETVLLGNFLDNTSGEIIFAYYLLPYKNVLSQIPISNGAFIRQIEKRKIL